MAKHQIMLIQRCPYVISESQSAFKTKHKNRLHAYFAGTNSYVGMKIGEAAWAHCFDFASSKLDFLKNAIIELTK